MKRHKLPLLRFEVIFKIKFRIKNSHPYSILIFQQKSNCCLIIAEFCKLTKDNFSARRTLDQDENRHKRQLSIAGLLHPKVLLFNKLIFRFLTNKNNEKLNL